MPVLRIKDGVSLLGLGPALSVAVQVAHSIYAKYGYDTVVTSATDGQHSATSLHYVGHAIDLRTRHVADGDLRPLAASLRTALGSDYDVVVEDTHIHLEWQPTRS